MLLISLWCDDVNDDICVTMIDTQNKQCPKINSWLQNKTVLSDHCIYSHGARIVIQPIHKKNAEELDIKTHS